MFLIANFLSLQNHFLEDCYPLKNCVKKFFGRKFLLLQNHFPKNSYPLKNSIKKFFGLKFFIVLKSFPLAQLSNKIFGQKVRWKFLIETYFWANDLATIKNFDQKFSMKIFGSNLFLGKWFCNNKNFRPKTLEENFWFIPIPEEMIFHPYTNLDKKIFDENVWFNPIPG